MAQTRKETTKRPLKTGVGQKTTTKTGTPSKRKIHQPKANTKLKLTSTQKMRAKAKKTTQQNQRKTIKKPISILILLVLFFFAFVTFAFWNKPEHFNAEIPLVQSQLPWQNWRWPSFLLGFFSESDPSNPLLQQKPGIADNNTTIGQGDHSTTNVTSYLKMPEPRLFFFRQDGSTGSINLEKVNRFIGLNATLAEVIQEMLKGPNQPEQRNGILSALDIQTKLLNLQYDLAESLVILDFNSAFEEGASRDIIHNRLQQIVYTATQFPGVQGVVVKINGRQKKSLTGDGVVIKDPLTRESLKRLYN